MGDNYLDLRGHGGEIILGGIHSSYHKSPTGSKYVTYGNVVMTDGEIDSNFDEILLRSCYLFEVLFAKSGGRFSSFGIWNDFFKISNE